MNLRPAIENYLLTCKAENKAPKTIRGYHDTLYAFLKFTGDIELLDLKPVHIQKYMASLQDHQGRKGPMSSHSMHKYYSVLRTFCRWLFVQSEIRSVPTQLLRPPRLSSDLPDALTPDEVKLLLGELRGETLRNRCIIKFFLDTGVRLNELATLKLTDLHLQDGWAKVSGKGSKERIVPLGAELCRDLHTYLNRRKAGNFERSIGLNYQDYVVIDERFFRPAEVEVLQGNANKARRILAWNYTHSFEDLVIEMVDFDLRLVSDKCRT